MPSYSFLSSGKTRISFYLLGKKVQCFKGMVIGAFCLPIVREIWAHLMHSSVKKAALPIYGFDWIPFQMGSWKLGLFMEHLMGLWLVFLINSDLFLTKEKNTGFLGILCLTFSLIIDLCASSLALCIVVPEAVNISFFYYIRNALQLKVCALSDGTMRLSF